MIPVEPVAVGTVRRHDVDIAFAVYGSGMTTVLLLPSWSIVPSRFWKLQVPYLSRHFRVITFDGRGTGGSGAPTDPCAYRVGEFAADSLAVLDATDTDTAAVVGLSCGAMWGLQLAAEQPARVSCLAFVAPAVPLAPPLPERAVQRFDAQIDQPVDWQKYNAAHWRRDYADFVDFFAGRFASEPHSTKSFDDVVEWASAIDPEVLVAAHLGPDGFDERLTKELAARVTCPSLVIHGTEDRIRGVDEGIALAGLMDAELVVVDGGGHGVLSRQPVLVNRALRSFIEREASR
jgi:pimeloyl-ACP methyl ester carboxylesterase